MVWKATKLIERNFTQNGVRFNIEENWNDGTAVSAVNAGVSMENGPMVYVLFFSLNNDNDVAIRLFELVSNVSYLRQDAVIKVLNDLNSEFRYMKFELSNGSVSIQYDLPNSTPDSAVGPLCFEMFVRFMKAADDAYPRIMKAMWG